MVIAGVKKFFFARDCIQKKFVTFFLLLLQVTSPLFLFCTTDLANTETIKESSLGNKKVS